MSQDPDHSECPDCRPSVLDQSGEPYESDHPVLLAVRQAWLDSTPQQRLAFHRLMVDSSESEEDVAICNPMLERMQAAIDVVLGAVRTERDVN